MALSTVPVDRVQFGERSERVAFMAHTFADVLHGRVLELGCDVRQLHHLRPELDYVGVDFGGDPTLRIDLEDPTPLPFRDGEFDVTVASEVLEHLDGLHRVFGELVRLSRRHVLISLPNAWTAARRPVGRGRGAIGHYGLPAERPKDRHKWFFSLSEAAEFAAAQQDRFGLVVRRMRACEKPRSAPLRTLRRLASKDREAYLNRFAHTLWVLFEKRV